MRSGALAILALLLALAALPPAARAQTAGATLTVIGGQVQVQLAGQNAFGPAADGQALGLGARVRTGTDGRAVLTFFDGTTATLDPSTEVLVERLDPAGGRPGGLLVTLQLSAGRVWSQVAALFDRGSSFEVRAAGASAVGVEGTFGYRLADDGTLSCWAISGSPLVLKRGDDQLVLLAGEQAVMAPQGAFPTKTARAFGPGLLEVRSEGVMLARLVSPQGLTVGFPLADLAVNQVLDASTSTPGAPDRWIRVPGPAEGAYALVLQPEANGPYIVRITLERDGRELATREWRGEARLGETLLAEVVVDARGGEPVGLRVGEPHLHTGAAPGNFIYP